MFAVARSRRSHSSQQLIVMAIISLEAKRWEKPGFFDSAGG
ncbi:MULTISPECIES: hypothetical protein [Kamptonema]|nr:MULTISPECIES: hypothetical protein [Kamptonema]